MKASTAAQHGEILGTKPARANVTLPLPPSVNGLYSNTRGGRRSRIKSPAYRAWIAEAGWTLVLAGKWRIGGRVDITMQVANTMRGDVDNRLKAGIDLLVEHDRIDDDRKVRRATVERVADVAADTCRIVVEPVL